MINVRARAPRKSRLLANIMLSASLWAIACSGDPVAVAEDFPDEPAPTVTCWAEAFPDP